MIEKLPYSKECDKPPPFGEASNNPPRVVQTKEISEKSVPPQFGETSPNNHPSDVQEPIDTLGQKNDITYPPFGVRQKKFQEGAHDSIRRSDVPVNTLQSNLRNFISHSIFLALICIIIYPVHWSSARRLTNAVNNLFTRTAAPSGKQFANIDTINDIWEYLNYQLVEGLYWEPHMNNISDFSFGKYQSDKALFNASRLLGQPKIRMVKVNQIQCSIVEQLAGVEAPCYADYEKRYEEKSSFYPKGFDGFKAFTYSTAFKLDNDDLHGSLATYGGGGFVQSLSEDDSKESLESIAFLKANRWIDRSTRLIVADFAVFNGRLNLFSVVKLIFELARSGGVIPTVNIDTLRLIRYTSPYHTFALVCELMFCAIVLNRVIIEFIDMCRYRSSYFKQFWNYIDLVVIGLSIACIKCSIRRTYLARNTINKVLDVPYSPPYPQDPEIQGYSQSFDQVARAENAYSTYAALLLIFTVLKTFKYIGIMLKKMSITVKEILVFAGMFFTLLFAFVHFGFLVYVSYKIDAHLM